MASQAKYKETSGNILACGPVFVPSVFDDYCAAGVRQNKTSSLPSPPMSPYAGEAAQHLLLHLLPVHQCRQPAVHPHHTHPQRLNSTFNSRTSFSIDDVSCVDISNIVRFSFFPAQECGIHKKEQCYPLAFGVPAALMFVALGKNPAVMM